MEIETKFNLWQKVYFMYKNKAKCLPIDNIYVRMLALGGGKKEINITYQMDG